MAASASSHPVRGMAKQFAKAARANPRWRHDEENEPELKTLGGVDRTDWGALGIRPVSPEDTSEKEIYLRVYAKQYGTSKESYPMQVHVVYSDISVRSRGVSLGTRVAQLYDMEDQQDEYDQAVAYEVEAIMENSWSDDDRDNIVNRWEVDEETGEKTERTEEERESEATDIAEQGELQMPVEQDLDFEEALKLKMFEIGVPDSVAKQMYGFFRDDEADDDEPGGTRITLMSGGEDEFIEMLDKTYQNRTRGPSHEMPPELQMAASEILENQSDESFDKVIETLSGIIPIWAASKNIYKMWNTLKEFPWMSAIEEAVKKGKRDLMKMEDLFRAPKGGKYAAPGEAKEFARQCIRAVEQMAWINENSKHIHPEAAKALENHMYKPYLKIKPKAKKAEKKQKKREKGMQMTVEMKKAKARKNPDETLVMEDLRDYYFAFPNDPDIPINLLKAEGYTSDELWVAATDLFKDDQIDPPDLRAITAAITTTDDPHMLVPNPKRNLEPLTGTPRERLRMALQHLDDVRIVDDRGEGLYTYSPAEEYAAYTPAPGPVNVQRTSDMMIPSSEMAEMFAKERKEHPDLPEEVVWKIVDDHLGTPRQNPFGGGGKTVDPIVDAFVEFHSAKGQMVQGTRRDETENIVTQWYETKPTIKGALEIAGNIYYLWENAIAALFYEREHGRLILSLATTGWHTNLTRDRLQAICDSLLAHDQGTGILTGIRFNIVKHKIVFTIGDEEGFVPDRLGYQEYSPDAVAQPPFLWFNLSARDPSKELDRVFGVKVDVSKEFVERETIEIPEIGLIQQEIDVIEERIRAQRQATRDWVCTSTAIAAQMGEEERYRELLEKRDQLMWRGNPSEDDYHMAVENPSERDSRLASAASSMFSTLPLGPQYTPKRGGLSAAPYVNIFGTVQGQPFIGKTAKLVYNGVYIASVERMFDSGHRVLMFFTSQEKRGIVNAYSKIVDEGIKMGFSVLRGVRFMEDQYGVKLNYRGRYWHITSLEFRPRMADPKDFIWFDLDEDPDYEARRILGQPLTLPELSISESIEMPEVGRIQQELDSIEDQVREYRERENDFVTNIVVIAGKLGLGDRYNQLCEARDELFTRGNPCQRRG